MLNDSANYSVLMSVYYRENPMFLRESIESMLSQTLKTDDFVIICDGPLTEELDLVLDEYENKYPDVIHIHRLKENGGLTKALNYGLPLAKNSLVARMDSDDISMPNRCETQVKRFLENDKLTLLGATLTEFITTEDKKMLPQKEKKVPLRYEEILRYSRRRNPFNHPTMMYRKEKVLEVGGYREWSLFEDYDLWTRMLAAGYVGENVEESLLYMRTEAGMYDRRGGWSYAKKAVAFRWNLHRSGYSSLLDFLVSACGQMLVCLVPSGIRKKIYDKALRKS
ncbi:MAG: glycosyltransferase [Lachnospiraceae bacterium]|nr:glycosyltransferase [Lachnospiraceae bacterium]